ncbi:hypothetical protein LCGC14_2315830 [marine sediment metagenome]|uniref:Uncharacterized protein n=1 Tax=marine sediment metagenome TaxID=412755 RepID=A0A0F9CJE1_9ZZZZ
MGAIIPLIGAGVDLIIRLIGVYNSLPDSDEAMKEYLRNLSDTLEDTKKKVAEVVIKDV